MREEEGLRAVCLDSSASTNLDSLDWGSDMEEDMFKTDDEEEVEDKDDEKEESFGKNIEEEVKSVETEEQKVKRELSELLKEVGIGERREMETSCRESKGKIVVEMTCRIDRATTEQVKLARSSREEAVVAATRHLMDKLKKRYFPEQVAADEAIVKHRIFLVKFCDTSGLPRPRYATGAAEHGYSATVTVAAAAAAPCTSAFLEEAEGLAAKAWLFTHAKDWKAVIANRPSSVAFEEEQGEVECVVGVEVEKVVEKRPRRARPGLAALDSLTKAEASARLACNILTASSRRSPRKRLMKGVFGSSSSSLDEGRTPEKAAATSPARKKPKLEEEKEARMVKSRSVSEMFKTQNNSGIGGKISPKKSVVKKTKLGQFKDVSDEESTEKKAFTFKSESSKKKEVTSEKENSPKKKEVKDVKDVRKTEVKSVKEDMHPERKKAASGSESKGRRKFGNFADCDSPKAGGGFKFNDTDKKDKEEKETVSKKTESKSKVKKPSKKEASPSPEASGSSVFEHVEDPDILEIRKRQEREARELARRSRSRTCRRSGALAKMADYQMSQSLGEAAAGKPRKRSSEEEKSRKKSGKKKSVEDKSQPKMGSFVTRTSREVETDAKVFASKDEEEEREEETEFEEYTPDINDILRLPERSEDGGKTKEEILDELDAEIGRRQRRHEQEMAEVDKEAVEVQREREERRRRSRRNAKLRDRLEEEMGEEAVRAMFARSLTHLEGIRAGSVASRRHAAFHQSVRARQALFYTMITHPFTDDQLAWVLEEMSKVWMRDKREQVENNEYVWKVLLPECFIKFYSDHFKVTLWWAW